MAIFAKWGVERLFLRVKGFKALSSGAIERCFDIVYRYEGGFDVFWC